MFMCGHRSDSFGGTRKGSRKVLLKAAKTDLFRKVEF